MATSPLQSFLGGTIPTAVVNNITNYVNTLFAGLGQTTTVVASSFPALTTSFADVPGVSVSVAATGANAICLAFATCGWICTVGSAGSYFAGDLVVDGVSQVANGQILTHADSTFNQQTDGRVWSFPLTATSHTIKLQARKSAAGPTGSTSGHTAMTVVLLDMP